MRVLATVHRSCECKSRHVRTRLSHGGCGQRVPGLCSICGVSYCLLPTGWTRLRSTLPSQEAPTQTAELHSITGLTGCNPDMQFPHLLYLKDSGWTPREAAAQQVAVACRTGVRPITSQQSFSAVRPQQAVSCGVSIVDSATTTREPAFTASGALLCVWRALFLVRATARRPSVEHRSMRNSPGGAEM